MYWSSFLVSHKSKAKISQETKKTIEAPKAQKTQTEKTEEKKKTTTKTEEKKT